MFLKSSWSNIAHWIKLFLKICSRTSQSKIPVKYYTSFSLKAICSHCHQKNEICIYKEGYLLSCNWKQSITYTQKIDLIVGLHMQKWRLWKLKIFDWWPTYFGGKLLVLNNSAVSLDVPGVASDPAPIPRNLRNYNNMNRGNE